METLNNEEMMVINGGGLGLGAILGIVGVLAVFVIGVIDGYVNPKSCNK